MNIFLPYTDDVIKSIQSLDDKRLKKQIIECHVMKSLHEHPEIKKGFANHPVVQHYTRDKRQYKFLCYYGYQCCKEYEFRFERPHAYSSEFPKTCYFGQPGYQPLYVEGRKDSHAQIRSINSIEVGQLFREKLIYKWDHDKLTPKWTKRDMPKFYKEEER